MIAWQRQHRSLKLSAAPGERGIALVAVAAATAVLLALGVGLALTVQVETWIAANQHDAAGMLHEADAALELALAELQRIGDWDALLRGDVSAAFSDGPAGARRLPDGRTVDLAAEGNRLRCGLPAPCSDAAMDAVTAERPWGRNNPRWQLFASGRLQALLPDRSILAHAYVAVWVADDAAENDAQPLADGQPPLLVDARNRVNYGRGALALRVQAYGLRGARRAIEAVVERDDRFAPSRLRVRVWRLVS